MQPEYYKKLINSINSTPYTRVLFKIVLIKKYGTSNEWYIYYGQANLIEKIEDITNNKIYDDENIKIYQWVGTRDNLQVFLSKQLEQKNYYLPGPLNRLDISSLGNFDFEYTWFGMQKKDMGLSCPCYEHRLRFSPLFTPPQNQIPVKYRSIHDLIKDKLNVDLDQKNGLQNTFGIFIEIGLGKIINFDYNLEENQIKAELDLNNDSTEYSLRLFYQIYKDHQKIYKDIDISEKIIYKFEEKVKPDVIELKLIYQSTIADCWEHITRNVYHAFVIGNGGDTSTGNKYIEDLELNIWKRKVEHQKAKIKVPSELDFGSFTERRLQEAEELDHPEFIIQKVAEAVEQLFKDFLACVGKTSDKSGVGLHKYVEDIWRSETKLPLHKLRFQIGIQHSIAICNYKKHIRYEPTLFEASFSILSAWQGYYGLLIMLEEIQNKPKNIINPKESSSTPPLSS